MGDPVGGVQPRQEHMIRNMFYRTDIATLTGRAISCRLGILA